MLTCARCSLLAPARRASSSHVAQRRDGRRSFPRGPRSATPESALYEAARTAPRHDLAERKHLRSKRCRARPFVRAQPARAADASSPSREENASVKWTVLRWRENIVLAKTAARVGTRPRPETPKNQLGAPRHASEYCSVRRARDGADVGCAGAAPRAADNPVRSLLFEIFYAGQRSRSDADVEAIAEGLLARGRRLFNTWPRVRVTASLNAPRVARHASRTSSCLRREPDSTALSEARPAVPDREFVRRDGTAAPHFRYRRTARARDCSKMDLKRAARCPRACVTSYCRE